MEGINTQLDGIGSPPKRVLAIELVRSRAFLSFLMLLPLFYGIACIIVKKLFAMDSVRGVFR